jgi:hypothetical protein
VNELFFLSHLSPKIIRSIHSMLDYLNKIDFTPMKQLVDIIELFVFREVNGFPNLVPLFLPLIDFSNFFVRIITVTFPVNDLLFSPSQENLRLRLRNRLFLPILQNWFQFFLIIWKSGLCFDVFSILLKGDFFVFGADFYHRWWWWFIFYEFVNCVSIKVWWR